MAQKVLILGESGTGKSASMRNFSADEVLVINSAGKPLPFKNHFEVYTPSYNHLTADIMTAMRMSKKPVIVVDDAQYIMSFQYMRRIKENGWDKWNDIQGDFFNIIQLCDELPENTIVYFLSHVQRDENGREKIKTMGKMLDEKITIEGLFTTVLKTGVTDGQYYFFTQNSGMDTVKSPMGMFPSYAIENDLKYVDTKIRNYYEMGEYASDEEVEKLDKEVAKDNVSKPENGRKRRARKSDDAVKPEAEEVKEEAASAGTEVKEEAPKTRRRKARAATDEEQPIKEEIAPEQAENAAEESKPKTRRRRSRKLTEEDMATDHTLDIRDDEIPF